jgi:hypothetical protein
LPLMPWFPVCSAFLAPRLPTSLYAVLRRPSSRSTYTHRRCGVAPLHSLCIHGIWYSRRPRHGFLDGACQVGYRIQRDARGQVVGLVVPKGLSRRPCCSRGQRLARFVRRRSRCGGRSFLGWDAFSCHGALHPRHGPQVSSSFLERRVRCRLSPQRVAFSALPRSFVSEIC